MNKSACDLMLYRTPMEVWHRGEALADIRRFNIVEQTEQSVEAEYEGSALYQLTLGFRSGGLNRRCSCPYQGDFCKHLVALAIVWDRSRGLEPPTQAEVEHDAVPSPLVTPRQVDALHAKPLKADLGILRIAASEMGSWSRPHTHLPDKPQSVSLDHVLTTDEIVGIGHELDRWTRRRGYDPYFCAGEMVAAYCETIRAMFEYKPADARQAAAILLALERLHKVLVLELIDDSNGEHVFGEAHIEELNRQYEDEFGARLDATPAIKEWRKLHESW
jgi:hypothetical protein